MKEYGRRNRLLNKLGWPSYDAYLASNLWAKIRAKQLRDHPHCYGCGRPASQVHHAKYTLDVMLGHNMDFLYSVCGGCHYRAEFDHNEIKNTLRQATKNLHKSRRKWDGHFALKLAMYATKQDNVDEQFRRRLEREP